MTRAALPFIAALALAGLLALALTRDVALPIQTFGAQAQAVAAGDYGASLPPQQFEEMEALGIDPHAVAVRLVESFYEQVFVHRLFHADPHPGNFIILGAPEAPVIGALLLRSGWPRTRSAGWPSVVGKDVQISTRWLP